MSGGRVSINVSSAITGATVATNLYDFSSFNRLLSLKYFQDTKIECRRDSSDGWPTGALPDVVCRTFGFDDRFDDQRREGKDLIQRAIGTRLYDHLVLLHRSLTSIYRLRDKYPDGCQQQQCLGDMFHS